jgi:hypothetical protein
MGGDVDVLPPFEWLVQVPQGYIGPLTFSAIGQVLGQRTGAPPEARVTVLVGLPPAVTLQGIRVRDDQKHLFMRTEGKRKLYVLGQFSDGVERDVSATFGTTYTSNDEEVATVDSEGLISARGVGTAKIKVENGNFELVVNATVRPRP